MPFEPFVAPPALSRRRLFTASASAGASLFVGAPGQAAERASLTVLVWLRGGADGLSLAVPYRDEAYYRARPTLAIAPPGRGSSASLRVTDSFALHPALAPLLPTFNEGKGSIVVGVGQPELQRSHARARQSLEGALSRGLGGRDPWRSSGSLSGQFRALSACAVRRAAPTLALLESPGWDTHAAQRSLFVPLAAELAAALSTFRSAFVGAANQPQILVFTEFGRSLPETPLAGTDDGHAFVALLLGGNTERAPVIGTWPGLAPEQLSAQRYVRPTLTFEALLHTCLAGG